uniref:Reverse transcriptase domain-containing protein n=1 Tax=Tanacetum cinerariifolium TaxID=118510 RepID=A0A6L2MYV2_TANCI|nr:reverse transcriptase domain-containing protein [Tanacetum cinerariifolium]
MSTRSGPSPTAPTSAVRNTVQQEKLNAVKARLNFEEARSTPSRRRDLRKRLGFRRIRSVFRSPEPRRGRSESPRKKNGIQKAAEGYIPQAKRQGEDRMPHTRVTQGVSRITIATEILKVATKVLAQEEQNLLLRNIITKEHPLAGRRYYQKVKPWVCEETDLFTPRIRYFDLPKRTRMSSHVKTYDGSEDPKDHLKIFQAATKVKRWAMPTCCHMFNSTLTRFANVWFDDLPPESVDSYDDLKEVSWKISVSRKSASKIPWKSTISSREKESLRRILCVDSRGRWQLGTKSRRSHFRHGNSRRPDISRISRKEVLKINKGQSGDMIEVRHNTDECMHLKRQIEELLKNRKLPHVIKELKQNGGKDQPKANNKRETSSKDKALAILMVQSWQRVARQRITQSFSRDPKITFLPLEEEEGTEGPMIIEAEIGGHFIHRIYVDGGSASKILYEYCFNRLRLKIKNQMVLAIAPLIGFSVEIIWPLGQL